MRRIGYIAITCVLGAAVVAGCSDDKKTDTTSGGGGGVTTPVAEGTPVSIIADDKSDVEQFFVLDPTSVSAGSVTFTFENKGDRQHEMVVLKTDTPFDQLEITGDRVSEDASLGEIGETDAGKTASFTVDLTPGKYVLVCNIEKHYGQGMRVAFTVTA